MQDGAGSRQYRVESREQCNSAAVEQWNDGRCRMRSISSDIFRRQQNDDKCSKVA